MGNRSSSNNQAAIQAAAAQLRAVAAEQAKATQLARDAQAAAAERNKQLRIAFLAENKRKADIQKKEHDANLKRLADAAQAEREKQIRDAAKSRADAEEKRRLAAIAKKKHDDEEYDRQQQIEKRQHLNDDANVGLTAQRHNIHSNNGAHSSTAVSGVATADSFTTLFEDDSYINLIAYNKMPYMEGLDSINNENQFIIDLLQFNKKYMRYIHRISNIHTNESIGLETEITTLYNNINNKIKKIQPSYEETKIDQSILQMRQDLDTKLKELYNTKDSTNSTNSNVYIEITMTLLATSLLYFFVKNA